MANRLNLQGTTQNSFDIGETNKLKLDSSRLTQNITLRFPDSNGTINEVLSTDGSGNLNWISQTQLPTSIVNTFSAGTTGLTPNTSTTGTIILSGTLSIMHGGTGATTATDALSNLGAYPATNPAGYTTYTGTVTNVGGTGSVNGISLSGSVTSSGNLTLGGTLSNVDINTQTTGTLAVSRGGTGQSNFSSGYIRSNGSALSSTSTVSGTDVSGNISGNAGNVTGVVAIVNGGTGATTASDALTNLGAYPATNPAGYTTYTGTVTNVGGTGSVNGISLSGTVTSSGNLTLGGTLSNVDINTQTTGTLAVTRGGTGATTAADALSNLGAYPATNPAGYTSNAGTVTSVGITSTDISVSGSPITTSGSVTLTLNTVPISKGGTGATTAADALTNLGAYPATNPGGYTTNLGTVTSVGGTGSVNGITLSGSVTSSGNLTLGGTLSGINLTTQVTGALPIANGGTGATSASAALSNLGAYPSSNPNGYTSNAGTVTSVGGTGSVNGITLSGTVTSSGNLTLGGTLSGVDLTTQVTGALPIANGGTGATSASAALTNLGAYPATNPNGYTSNAGTVTSVGGTGSVNGITLSGSVTSSGNLTLGGTLSGIDLTTQVTGALPIPNGGTGATSASAALSNLGAYPATNPAGYTTNLGTVTSVGGTGSVNGITLSGSVTSSGNLTLGGTLSGIDLTTQVTGALPIPNGGTGATSATDALSNLGAYPATNPAGYITSASVGNGTLSLGVSGVGLSGSASFTANQSGESTFTVSSNATSSGTTQNTIVSRGASGAIEVGAITANGTITATGDITAFSDERIKDNIATIENALSLVKSLRGVRYTRKDDGSSGIGLVAQEAQKILPEVIHELNGFLSVAYGNIVGLLVESIKELDNKVSLLEQELIKVKTNANTNN
jgi:hypothetical protein